MMESIIACFLLFWIFCNNPCSGGFRQNIFNGPCDVVQFKCTNDVCIDRNQFCDGYDDCGDNSDEEYCNGGTCPNDTLRCPRANRCIPIVWRCDGKNDCGYYQEDENQCDEQNTFNYRVVASARNKAIDWIRNQTQNRFLTDQWGPHVQKTAVALFLASSKMTSPYLFMRDMAYELSIQLLSRFSRKKLKEVSTADLASYINALLVTCIDPRNFHFMDLVKELRSRVDAKNYSNPYDILTLCNAGEKITKEDVDKLSRDFWIPHRATWTETQAIAVMALVCAGNQPDSSFSLENIQNFSVALKQNLYRNGEIENLQTAALVMQALFTSENGEDENFDEEKTFRQILGKQKNDGSFGNILETYYVLPVLNFRSLVNINSDHCKPYINDEVTELHNLINQPGSKIRMRYSLWIGEQKDVEKMLKLRVPNNSSFYDVIEKARDIDSQYRFQYVMRNEKPSITALSGIPDDPEAVRFWFPYIFNDTKPSLLNLNPADVILKDNDHVAMWYRSGSWID